MAGSKMTKVDLDVKGTELVRAELDVDDHYYYIDPTACICWVSRLIGGSNSTSTFDCSKLAAYPKLEQYIKKCSEQKKEIIAEEIIKEEVVIETPVVTEEPKKDSKK